MIVLGYVLSAILCASAAKGFSFQSSPGIENSRVLTTPELVNEWGYETEEHEITSEDGYILTNFRLKRKNVSVPLGAKVFLLISGYLASSDYYLLMTEKPFYFRWMDDGYDVWLGNVRGCRYGKRHKILSSTDVDFWDYSNHEPGVYDVPAIIDYILEKTGNTKLGYIGYSQGTTIFHIMMSEKPEYNEKVALMIAFSPAVYFKYSNNIAFKLFALYGVNLFEFARRTKFIELLSFDGPIVDLLKRACITAKIYAPVCRPLMWDLVGISTNGQNDDSVRELVKYSTSGAFKAGVHYGQLLSGKFQQYKYRTRAENIQKYGSVEPPEYNIKNTRVPVVLITAVVDQLVNYRDVENLARVLPNFVYYEKYPYEYYGHYSIVSARNASQHLYAILQPILSEILFR